MVAPTSKPSGKDSKVEELPRRDAKATIVKGDPMQRVRGNYAKNAPSLQEQFPGLPMGMAW